MTLDLSEFEFRLNALNHSAEFCLEYSRLKKEMERRTLHAEPLYGDSQPSSELIWQAEEEIGLFEGEYSHLVEELGNYMMSNLPSAEIVAGYLPGPTEEISTIDVLFGDLTPGQDPMSLQHFLNAQRMLFSPSHGRFDYGRFSKVFETFSVYESIVKTGPVDFGNFDMALRDGNRFEVCAKSDGGWQRRLTEPQYSAIVAQLISYFNRNEIPLTRNVHGEPLEARFPVE